MLSEQVRQLLSAYVDGELSHRQRKLALRLLHRTPEARALLQALQEDAQRLRQLTRVRLGPDFTTRVLQALPRSMVSRRPAAEVSVPLWKGLAIAATVLLLVGFASFLYFARASRNPVPGSQVVEHKDSRPLPEVRPPSPSRGSSGKTPAPEPSPSLVERIPLPPTVVVENPHPPRLNPKPDIPNIPEMPSVNTLPVDGLELFKASVATVPLLSVVNVRDIQRSRLEKEFHKDSAFRIELPCRDTARGFRRVEAALRDNRVHLFLERAVGERLKQPRWKANYILFLENLTPEDLARILTRVGSEDKKAAERKTKPDGQFSKMVLYRMSEADRKELQDLLRAEIRPLPGSSPRPDSTQPAGKATEPLGLAVTYNPERPPPGSAEVKRFFDARKPLRPGALQVLLVLREAQAKKTVRSEEIE